MAKIKRKIGRAAKGYVNVLARIEPEQHAKLKALSEKSGAPMNHYIRVALDDYLREWRRMTSGLPGNGHTLRQNDSDDTVTLPVLTSRKGKR
jgi:Ribbon-helix-helix protein, copG family.